MLSLIVDSFKITPLCLIIALILPFALFTFPLCGCLNNRPVPGFMFALRGNNFPDLILHKHILFLILLLQAES